jgi:hypothetical protein
MSKCSICGRYEVTENGDVCEVCLDELKHQEQRCLEISAYFLDEKEMNKVADDDWSEYYCNHCLAERTNGVFTRASHE